MPYALFDTAIGPCAIAWSDAGVTAVQLPEASRDATRARLLARTSMSERDRDDALTSAPAWAADAVTRLCLHLEGSAQDLSKVPLDLARVTPFAAEVYRALQAVPTGETRSYGDLARAVGSPGAARAVGRAMATNPFPLLVPCHRVLAAAGGVGGFSAYGGVLTKERILAIEGARRRTSAPPKKAASLFAGHAAELPFDRDAAVRTLAARDAKLARHMTRVGPFALRLKETEGTFAALAESIVYQQLSGRAAATIFARVRALYPRGRLDPARVLETKESALRGAGLSGSKLASLRDLAARTVSGRIPSLAELSRMDDEAIVERLTEVRGVGRWTVEMLLIFRLGRPDVLPLADYGIKKGFARVFWPKTQQAELPSAADMAARGERWRPYRSVASWYLWRALDATA